MSQIILSRYSSIFTKFTKLITHNKNIHIYKTHSPSISPSNSRTIHSYNVRMYRNVDPNSRRFTHYGHYGSKRCFVNKPIDDCSVSEVFFYFILMALMWVITFIVTILIKDEIERCRRTNTRILF